MRLYFEVRDLYISYSAIADSQEFNIGYLIICVSEGSSQLFVLSP